MLLVRDRHLAMAALTLGEAQEAYVACCAISTPAYQTDLPTHSDLTIHLVLTQLLFTDTQDATLHRQHLHELDTQLRRGL